MLWEVDIYPAEGLVDRPAQRLAWAAGEVGLAVDLRVAVAHGYLIQGDLDRSQLEWLTGELLADNVAERTVIGQVGDSAFISPPPGCQQVVHVLPKPGVMDPVAHSAISAFADLGTNVEAVRTLRKYWFGQLPDAQLQQIANRLLANDSIEQVIIGPLELDRLDIGSDYRFQLVTVPIRDLDEASLERLSRQGQLFLSPAEMRAIQAYYRDLRRDPTDAELETIAQTWSEHCSHKTLKGRIRYRDEHGERQFQNMLKETIFAATDELRRRAGTADWCVSVFEDNAGIVRFDPDFHVTFKVETHNHPSALEPYGGANTGLGGVLRDTLGTGLGARPVCNTDIFCFAPPDVESATLPSGVLHPRRVLHGVVSGVRDYGNRMGIPTVNGAIYFDQRYLGNPLVFCGSVGLIPAERVRKEPQPGDLIVTVGGRTGRDGIHGATFSSAELTEHSETLSGGAVQIGNAITEKMVLDVVLAARDRGLYHAITDCGAGGFSSAVGEMAERIGAVVQLDRAPLKYAGLSYTEIWISEAQERMVLAVPERHWQEFSALCGAENVEATVIGKFEPTGRLRLYYGDHPVADVDLKFLHGGRPPVVRDAVYEPARIDLPRIDPVAVDPEDSLLTILGSLNVASKEWVIRQYDHEVQGGSVVKPLVGAANDGPSDAAVVRPVLGSRRGIVVACGMNPRFGDFDTYWMAAGAIDEAVRNCIAVGADPGRIALLDNFCWGNTDRPETLGSLVRAALGCRDLALELGTPFISGKDSLNNEFRYADADGVERLITIPPSLLISAVGQIDDVARAVTMDFKAADHLIYLVGATRDELGGSHFTLVNNLSGGEVPKVKGSDANAVFTAVHQAISAGTVRACHDLSEGGLGVAVAEMAFAGGFGARIALGDVPTDIDGQTHNRVGAIDLDIMLLFSESNTRFLCEVAPDRARAFEDTLAGIPHACIGKTLRSNRLEVFSAAGGADVIDLPLDELKMVWQKPLAR